MQRPEAMHLPSTHESSPRQSPLSLQVRGSQQPEAPQTFVSPHESAAQRATQPSTHRTSSLLQRLAGAGSRASGSRHTRDLPQSESR